MEKRLHVAQVGSALANQLIARSEEAMLNLLHDWRLKPAVEALMAFKGFRLLAAMITISELGGLSRAGEQRILHHTELSGIDPF